MTSLPDLSCLSHDEKDALILALWSQVQELTERVLALESTLGKPAKAPDNSSVPPSKGQKSNRLDKAKRLGPRKGSLGRDGGGRALAADPDDVVVAKPARCGHCQAAFSDADQTLDARYDKIDLPPVRPVVTRVEQYAGRCRCCGATTLAAVPQGLEPGTPFSLNIVALAMYLRFVHAVSYKRLTCCSTCSAWRSRWMLLHPAAKARWMPRSDAASHASMPISPLFSPGCGAPA